MTPSRKPHPARLLAGLLIAPLALALGACSGSSAATDEASASQASSAESWPRTIEFDGGSVTLDEAPQRIVALSSDVADVAMQLVDASRIAAVPDINRSADQSLQYETAATIEGSLASGANAEVEEVLAFDPDLVLVTTRHDAETDAFDQMEQAGVPVLAITNGWDSPETFQQNVAVIGRALGAEDEAAAVSQAYGERWQKVTDALAGVPDDDQPSTAMLRIIAGSIYYCGPGSINQAVLSAAGASLASETIGLTSSQRAEVEQVVESAPERIVLLDSTGRGRSQYDELLSNPGLQAVPAVADDQVLLVSAAAMSSGSGGIDALEQIAAWLHPDLF
ncbi:ABC transporter substrate-binding protein [Brooklawnia cerclae]|uniref:Iron complex transport system substrate-binding protein n=1 Tax=Brooklawnia cerclae TaxID=349934 RepID=A0ABX0SDL5_9ACTN|nr:ABC transporter substrate-binding protein [Brooklawnia cerclae]NIH55418.1 iron complex transport system substrate-binding protein [Brooklawnia cerclae]